MHRQTVTRKSPCLCNKQQTGATFIERGFSQNLQKLLMPVKKERECTWACTGASKSQKYVLWNGEGGSERRRVRNNLIRQQRVGAKRWRKQKKGHFEPWKGLGEGLPTPVFPSRVMMQRELEEEEEEEGRWRRKRWWASTQKRMLGNDGETF